MEALGKLYNITLTIVSVIYGVPIIFLLGTAVCFITIFYFAIMLPLGALMAILHTIGIRWSKVEVEGEREAEAEGEDLPDPEKDVGIYPVEIDFDEASRAWRQNKARRKGALEYRCGEIRTNGKRCRKKPMRWGRNDPSYKTVPFDYYTWGPCRYHAKKRPATSSSASSTDTKN